MKLHDLDDLPKWLKILLSFTATVILGFIAAMAVVASPEPKPSPELQEIRALRADLHQLLDEMRTPLNPKK